MHLSLNFRLSEFLHSDTAAGLGYRLVPDDWTVEQIQRLIDTALQPIRDELGKSITITSGYRPAWLNWCLRGSKDSRHLYGCAVDFVVADMTTDEAFGRIKAMNLELDQLIVELPDSDRSWIHLGLALPGQPQRKQYMIATRDNDGRMTYLNA